MSAPARQGNGAGKISGGRRYRRADSPGCERVVYPKPSPIRPSVKLQPGMARSSPETQGTPIPQTPRARPVHSEGRGRSPPGDPDSQHRHLHGREQHQGSRTGVQRKVGEGESDCVAEQSESGPQGTMLARGAGPSRPEARKQRQSTAAPATIRTAVKLPASISPARNAKRASRELAAKNAIVSAVSRSVRRRSGLDGLRVCRCHVIRDWDSPAGWSLPKLIPPSQINAVERSSPLPTGVRLECGRIAKTSAK